MSEQIYKMEYYDKTGSDLLGIFAFKYIDVKDLMEELKGTRVGKKKYGVKKKSNFASDLDYNKINKALWTKSILNWEGITNSSIIKFCIIPNDKLLDIWVPDESGNYVATTSIEYSPEYAEKLYEYLDSDFIGAMAEYIIEEIPAIKRELQEKQLKN